MSYFVGHKAVQDGHKEDAGFAINGGKGWADVVFDNHQIEVNGNSAIAMGNYYFTSCADGSKTKVEYTFGYKKNADGNVRIFLHHSSASWLQFRVLIADIARLQDARLPDTVKVFLADMIFKYTQVVQVLNTDPGALRAPDRSAGS